MIIQALCELYDRLERGTADGAAPLAPFGYSVQKISFVVVLNLDGTLHAVEDARVEVGQSDSAAVKGKGKPRRIPRSLVVPAIPGRTVAIEAGFLCDNTAYLLGLGGENAKLDRVRECFRAFRERHLALRSAIDDDGFAAVCTFLQSWEPDRTAEHPVLAELAGAFGVFQIRGRERFVHESDAVRAYWDEQVAVQAAASSEGESDAASGARLVGPSLVSGRSEPLARLHEPAIKGVVGAQTSGAKLASFNCPAFESHGQSQTYNAPVGVRDAFRYCTALNYLLSSDRHRARLGDTTLVFWTDAPKAVELFGQVIGAATQDDPMVTRIGEIAERARQGLPTELGDPTTPFYVLGLGAPAKSRLAVRLWCRTSVGAIVHQLEQRQRQLQLENPYGDVVSMSLRALAAATARIKKNGETEYESIDPWVTNALAHAVIDGRRLPRNLLQRLIHRISSDGFITHARLSLLKLCLLDTRRIQMDAYLNKVHPEPAYHCGRLFAVIAFAQEQAIGDIKAGVVRRSLGGVLAAPGLTLPRIEKTAEMAYYPKINDPLRTFVQDHVRDIHGELRDGYPKTLDPVKQGAFLLGFYQQDQWLSSRAGLFKGKTPPLRTARGDWVRSRGEVRVADCLLSMGVDYIYEPRKLLATGPERWPDFYVQGASPADDVYIEYLGMEDNPEYDNRWRQKQEAYRDTGITETGGPAGRLIVLDARTAPVDDVAIRRALRGLVNQADVNAATA